MRQLLKWIILGLFSLLAALFLIGFLFLKFSPQFGESATATEQIAYAATGHYENGIFLNEEAIDMKVDCHSIQKMLEETLNPDPNVAPKQDVQVKKIAPETILNKPDSLVRVTWFGHSTFLIEIDGKIILLDPIFGQYAAPHRWLGRKRFNSEMPIGIAQLPTIDAIVISHDHYDHLDYESIKQLKVKTDHFFVPLGVDNHLERWGVAEEKISKMDWWEEQNFKGLTIAFTPSRHMSGRGLGDQSATLWGSWVIRGSTRSVFFSGDGGYGKHFSTIGEKYGGFDIALMECGQYNQLWADVHMMPEQTVRAGQEVRAKLIVPVHWGSFALSTHSWTDPVERIMQQAQKVGMPIATPQIGEPIILDQSEIPRAKWWEGIK